MISGSVLDIFTKIVGSYNLLLIIVSLILNPIVFFVCLKSKNLRSTSTFKLLAFGSINDLFVCVAWNLEAFAVSFFNYVAYYRSLFFCKWITLFIQLTSLEIEVWLLVGISFDRLLSMSIKKWSSHYFNGIKPIIYSVIMIVVMASVNFFFLFIGGYSYVSNATEIIACFETPPDYNIDWFNIMQNVTIFFGFLTPSTILVLVNFVIIYKATRFERRNRVLVVNVSKTPTAILEARGAKRKQEMTKTILIITFLFVVVSFPSFLVNCFFLFQVLTLEYGQLIMNLVCAIQYSYPAFNFFILYFSNKRFSLEVKNTIRSFHVSSNSVQTTQRT